MSVGKICDNDNSVLLTKTKATVKDCKGKVICVFERNGNGLYLYRFRLRAPSTHFHGQGARR